MRPLGFPPLAALAGLILLASPASPLTCVPEGAPQKIVLLSRQVRTEWSATDRANRETYCRLLALIEEHGCVDFGALKGSDLENAKKKREQAVQSRRELKSRFGEPDRTQAPAFCSEIPPGKGPMHLDFPEMARKIDEYWLRNHRERGYVHLEKVHSTHRKWDRATVLFSVRFHGSSESKSLKFRMKTPQGPQEVYAALNPGGILQFVLVEEGGEKIRDTGEFRAAELPTRLRDFLPWPTGEIGVPKEF